MTTAAKVENGVVTEIIAVASHDPADIPAGYQDCPDGTGIGYTYDSGADTYSAPDPPEIVLTDADYTKLAQNHLDARAKTMGYENIATAVTYTGSGVAEWAAEANALTSWRDDVWGKVYEILADIDSGARTAPDAATFISELPAYNGPT